MEWNERSVGMAESFLFIAGEEGLTSQQLEVLLDLSREEVQEVLRYLEERYEEGVHFGITLRKFGGTFRLVTKSEFAEDIQRMLENPKPQTMTQASMEVLAIIAYKQPVTRVEIDDLRGVKSERALQTLVARGFVMEVGRLEGTGRPILYGTTDFFLDRFGLATIEELPPLLIDEEEETDDPDLFMTKFQEAFSINDEGGTL